METITGYRAKINRITVSGQDDSFTEIVTIAMPINRTAKYSGEYNYSDLRDAMERINEEMNEIHISRPCSAYDCTGQAFTTSLEVVNRYHHCDTLVYVIRHNVSIDI